MKKILIALAAIISVLSINKEEKVVIPKDSIRFRVIANSNNDKDQIVKKRVVSNLKNNIGNLEFSNKDIKSSRENIKNKIPEFSNVIEKTLQEEKSNLVYNINYGMNYFPEKEYEGVIYKEGEYESLVITLGNGQGENFWCVLFPPLCLLDEENSSKKNDIEYTSFVKEVIDKYF